MMEQKEKEKGVVAGMATMRKVPSAGNLKLLETKPKMRRASSQNAALDDLRISPGLASIQTFAMLHEGGGTSSGNSSPLSAQPMLLGSLGNSNLGGVGGLSGLGKVVEERLKELDMTRAVKAPASEVYGFVAYLASLVAFGIFLMWAYLPESTLKQLGFTFYPDKYWAVALPIYGLSLLFFVFVFFLGINFLQTPPLSSVFTITDEHANMIEDLGSQIPKNLLKIPETMDIPISVVNKCLYQNIDDEIVRMRKRRPWVV